MKPRSLACTLLVVSAAALSGCAKNSANSPDTMVSPTPTSMTAVTPTPSPTPTPTPTTTPASQ